MAKVMQRILDRARVQPQRIVLPEGNDDRIVAAAALITRDRVAAVTLLGNPDDIRQRAKLAGVDLSGVTLVDPATDPRADKYAALLYERRRSKGATPGARSRVWSASQRSRRCKRLPGKKS